MPEDQVVEEESAELSSGAPDEMSAEEEAAFGAEAEGRPAPAADYKKPDGDNPDDAPAAKDAAAAADKPGEKKDAPTADDNEQWAKNRLEQIQKAPVAPPHAPGAGERAAAPGTAPAAQKPDAPGMPVITDERIKQLFGEGKIKVGDKEVDIAEFREADPVGFEAIAVMATLAAEKLAGEALKNAGFVTKQEAASIQAQIAELKFWGAVGMKHPDYANYISIDGGPAPDAEFEKWLKAAPPAVNWLAGQLHEPEDAIRLIGMYKDHQQREKAAKIDQERADRKKKTDALLGTKPAAPNVEDNKKAASDEEAAFREEASKK